MYIRQEYQICSARFSCLKCNLLYPACTLCYNKENALKEKSWCKSISAFANGMGGVLIFGISDNDEIIGLLNAEHNAEIIREQIKERLNPIPNFKKYVKTPSLTQNRNVSSRCIVSLHSI